MAVVVTAGAAGRHQDPGQHHPESRVMLRALRANGSAGGKEDGTPQDGGASSSTALAVFSHFQENPHDLREGQ
jgi:hypothetical protein